MDNPTPPPQPGQKKGMSPLAWVGIGCGGLLLIGIIVVVVAFVFVGGKVKDFANNPTRGAASMVVQMGVADMVAEDDVNKRYTIKEKESGKLLTFYWNPKTNSPESVEGDFSAIPVAGSTPTPVIEDAPATPTPTGN